MSIKFDSFLSSDDENGDNTTNSFSSLHQTDIDFKSNEKNHRGGVYGRKKFTENEMICFLKAALAQDPVPIGKYLWEQLAVSHERTYGIRRTAISLKNKFKRILDSKPPNGHRSGSELYDLAYQLDAKLLKFHHGAIKGMPSSKSLLSASSSPYHHQFFGVKSNRTQPQNVSNHETSLPQCNTMINPPEYKERKLNNGGEHFVSTSNNFTTIQRIGPQATINIKRRYAETVTDQIVESNQLLVGQSQQQQQIQQTQQMQKDKPVREVIQIDHDPDDTSSPLVNAPSAVDNPGQDRSEWRSKSQRVGAKLLSSVLNDLHSMKQMENDQQNQSNDTLNQMQSSIMYLMQENKAHREAQNQTMEIIAANQKQTNDLLSEMKRLVTPTTSSHISPLGSNPDYNYFGIDGIDLGNSHNYNITSSSDPSAGSVLQ